VACRLTLEAEGRRREAEEARLQTAAAEWAQSRISHYIQQGYDDKIAQQLGVLEAREQLSAYRAQQANLRSTRIELFHQYGVPQEQLANFTDEAAMRHFAQQYALTSGPQARRIQELEARLAALEKGRVPAQNFNQPGTGSMPAITSDNIDLLYLQGKITDDRYRRFRETGQ